MLRFRRVLGIGAVYGKMIGKTLRPPTMFAAAFLTLAVVYGVFFNIAVRLDAGSAEYRFNDLVEMGALKRAASHGDRLIKLSAKAGATQNELASLKVRVSETHLARRDYDRATELLRAALSTAWAKSLSKREYIKLEDQLARTALLRKDFQAAAAIYASFVELSRDASVNATAYDDAALEVFYAERVNNAAETFAESLNYAAAEPLSGADEAAQLASASHMAAIGGYYALVENAEYAAAGLLATAYETRKELLGGDHRDTVQLVLSLGPVYMSLGRVEDAEKLYLEAFHAQENANGSNTPRLSLYIKLLGSVYERQGRNTEAEALYKLMRAIFADAFGSQRYAANQQRDPKTIFNRPVSQFYPLEDSYSPNDLVSAAAYSIPTSKSPSIDEMKLRLAADLDEDAREANMPVRLAQLISLCRSDSTERISLRSGYRSYSTQNALHVRNGDRGTVAPAGMSEHQTGLAADIDVNGRFMRQSDRAYQCFEENAFRYGFILSYPPNNNYLPGSDNHEPWHWRYVGIQTAQLFREAGPYRKPQEFLAALPCYQERARSGSFPAAGEVDLCLIDQSGASSEPVIQAVNEEPDETARILNEKIQSFRER